MVALPLESGIDRQVPPLVHGGLRRRDGDRRVGGDLVRQRNRSGDGIARGGDPVDQPDLQRFLRLHPARGEDQVLGPPHADETREPDRAAAAGDHAHLRLRQADQRSRIHHAQIAHQRQLAPATERETVDRGDPGLGAALDLAHGGVQLDQPAPDVVLRPAAPFLEIRAGAEGAPSGSGDDHRAHGRRAFCAGANLKERRGWTEDDVRRWLVELHAAMREIERCPKPWIAAINGLALGGGCELALVCDLRVMDPAALIGLTETKGGVIPGGGGTVRLPRLVGMGRAKDLILTARRVEAQEALQIGLVNRISAAGDSVSAAVALAHEIAANAPIAVSAAKASVDEGWDLPIDAALERERHHYEKPLLSEDRLEGLKAFAEKRPPGWRGK